MSLIQVLSEKSESTHHRSDILNSSISSPCVALGSAHILSGRTLNICRLCCLQHPVLVCRQPVSAFLFNQVEQDKSLSPGSSIKQTLEMIAGLS